jgi:hypothetical protein
LEDVSTLVRTLALSKAAWVFHVSGSQSAWAGVAGVNIDISTARMVAMGIAFLNIPIFISRKTKILPCSGQSRLKTPDVIYSLIYP